MNHGTSQLRNYLLDIHDTEEMKTRKDKNKIQCHNREITTPRVETYPNFDASAYRTLHT